MSPGNLTCLKVQSTGKTAETSISFWRLEMSTISVYILYSVTMGIIQKRSGSLRMKG